MRSLNLWISKNVVVKNQPKARALRFEGLEDRQLLAGGGVTTEALLAQIAALQAQLTAGGGGGTTPVITMPSPKVNVSVSGVARSILPGAQKVPLLDMYISATRPYAQVVDMTFVSTTEIASMAWNFGLWADLNSNPKDGVNGCETFVAMGTVDQTTGAVIYQFYQKNFVTQKPTHMVATADFGTYLQGDSLFFDLAWANFRDPAGKAVPDTKINIYGIAPTHKMQSAMMSMQERQMLPAQSVIAGQQEVEVFTFDVWTNHAQPTSLSFVAKEGKLSYVEKPTLSVDVDYDGKYDKVFSGTVVNNALTFRFSTVDFNGFYSGNFSVSGNIAQNTAGQHLQLGFPANGQGISGNDSQTGKPLVKFTANGGEGQIRLNLIQPSWATVFTIVNPQPVLAVKELPAEPAYQPVEQGQENIVLDAFSVYAEQGHNITLNTVAVAANAGDFSMFTYYILWWDSDSDGNVDTSTTTKARQDGKQMYFENLAINVGAGQSMRMEVRAKVNPDTSPETSAYGCLRLGLAQDGIKATENAVDVVLKDIFIGHDWQTFYYLQGGGLG